jgi:GT2 family glycosyltransferase
MKEKHDNFVLVDWSTEKLFSYARSCNEGARVANGDVLIMLNNDTEVITPNWIELLVGEAIRKDVGAVGCLLLYPGGEYVQHAGVGVGLGGVAANALQHIARYQSMSRTQSLYMKTRHNMTAVTAACMAIRSSVFHKIGGFDETFRITYNDVDLCLKLVDAGYLNVYTPHVQLIHYESISLGLPEEIAKRDMEEFQDSMDKFKSRWTSYIKHDPALNTNLNKSNAFYDIQ